MCGRDGRTICGPLRVPKSTYVTLAHKRKPKFFYFGCSVVRPCNCKQSTSAHGTDGQTDRRTDRESATQYAAPSKGGWPHNNYTVCYAMLKAMMTAIRFDFDSTAFFLFLPHFSFWVVRQTIRSFYRQLSSVHVNLASSSPSSSSSFSCTRESNNASDTKQNARLSLK